MSGGSLGYFFGDLQSHVGDFEDKELDDLTEDLAELFHEREWFLSSDISEGEWNLARDNFKKKWFTNIGRQERIQKYLDAVKQEVMRSFGFGQYCGDCVNWIRCESPKKYGKCKLKNTCLIHEGENACEKFEGK